jgi:thiazole synthase ThiGH ThiG subunit
LVAAFDLQGCVVHFERRAQAYLAGRMPRRLYADPSSPLGGLI